MTPKIFTTLRIIWPSKLAILMTLTLLHRFKPFHWRVQDLWGKSRKPAEVQTTQMSYDGTGFQAMNVPLKRGGGLQGGPRKTSFINGGWKNYVTSSLWNNCVWKTPHLVSAIFFMAPFRSPIDNDRQFRGSTWVSNPSCLRAPGSIMEPGPP